MFLGAEFTLIVQIMRIWTVQQNFRLFKVLLLQGLGNTQTQYVHIQGGG